MHPDLSPEDASAVVINHPNQYYELAQKVSKGIPLTSGGDAEGSQGSRVKIKPVKVPLNDSQMTNQSMEGFEDTSMDEEMLKISSTLQEYGAANLDF